MASQIYTKKPPMDPELKSAFDSVAFPLLSRVTPETVTAMRSATVTPSNFLEDLESRGISHRELQLPSTAGSDHKITLSILEPISKLEKPRPCVYWIHGGGFHWGDRLHTTEYAIDMILECGATCVSVEYRLAPEHSFFTAVEDCYAGLKWTSDHTEDLGVDPKRLLIGGTSAGGTLAASTALLCRDRQGPHLCGQFLVCPALDPSLTTVSSHQYVETSDFFPREAMADVFNVAFKDRLASQADITIPAEAVDFSGLPSTYLDVGSAEVLRDDSVAYASRLWACGVQTELHVWAGAFHGFDMFVPESEVSQAARKLKVSWAKRVFGMWNTGVS